MALLLLAISAAGAAAPPPLICPAGAPIANVELMVRSPRGAELPLKTINRLGEGDTIVYRPLLRVTETRKGEVAIVLVPVSHAADTDPITVLDPKPASGRVEWKVPFLTSVAVFVYGPAGLNRSKVKHFLSKDDGLVSQLADYAEKTAQAEALIAALSSDMGSGDSINAAFRGFASQYGTAQIDHAQSMDQQMILALRTLNPAVANYDPIAPQSSQRIGQTASLATSVAALFFGSPVGLAAGGTAMLLEMRSILFPNTVFRSSFAQAIQENGLGLCGKRDAVPAHTKVAYLWATRVPNIGPPHITVAKAESLPIGMKAPLQVEAPSEQDWKYLDRARKWTLESEAKGQKPIPVPVHPGSDPKQLEIDLSKVSLKPGSYHLAADWDWDAFVVNGNVSVAALSDFQRARLERESQDQLVAKSGRTTVTVAGSNFEFVTKVELVKPGDKFFTPASVPFALPKGFRAGDQTRMEIQINASDLDPGDYRLMVSQADGKPHPVPVAVLAPGPRVDGAPFLIHEGDLKTEITLRGEHLDRIASIQSGFGKATLGPASTEGNLRKVSLESNSGITSGRSFDLQLFVENRSVPLVIANALQVTGPRASITGSRVSLPPDSDISIKPGELPSSYVLTAMLQVSGFDSREVLALECQGEETARITLSAAGKNPEGSLELLGPGSLFLTFDDSRFPNGCELLAIPGAGAGHALGRIVHVPKIRALDIVPTPAGSSGFEADLKGVDLQTIERVGWDPENGTPVNELPSMVPGEGQTQVLRIRMSEGPSSLGAPLYVWLRGEATGRATSVRAAVTTKPKPASIK